MKKCSKCKEDKELNEYCKKKSSKDGYHQFCKNCRSENNKKEHNLYKNIRKEYYKSNKKEKIEYQMKYFLLNKINIKKSKKIYELKNKDKILEYTKNYRRKKYNNDEKFKLSMILRIRINQALKGINKFKRTLELLGCTIEFYKQYIESQFKPEMNWNNHGKIWEIDHIIGCINFDLTKFEEQAKCFHYTNMQPLFITTQIAESFGYINEIGNRNKNRKQIVENGK